MRNKNEKSTRYEGMEGMKCSGHTYIPGMWSGKCPLGHTITYRVVSRVKNTQNRYEGMIGI